MVVEAVERLSEPEINEDHYKIIPDGCERAIALMKSQQLCCELFDNPV